MSVLELYGKVDAIERTIDGQPIDLLLATLFAETTPVRAFLGLPESVKNVKLGDITDGVPPVPRGDLNLVDQINALDGKRCLLLVTDEGDERLWKP